MIQFITKRATPTLWAMIHKITNTLDTGADAEKWHKLNEEEQMLVVLKFIQTAADSGDIVAQLAVSELTNAVVKSLLNKPKNNRKNI